MGITFVFRLLCLHDKGDDLHNLPYLAGSNAGGSNNALSVSKQFSILTRIKREFFESLVSAYSGVLFPLAVNACVFVRQIPVIPAQSTPVATR